MNALAESFRNQDMHAEHMLADFMDEYLYSKLTTHDGRPLVFERMTDKESQLKGVDISIENGNKKINIDEKASIYYSNLMIPTFAFELASIQRGYDEPLIGWFLNDELDSKYYMLIWPNIKCIHNKGQWIRQQIGYIHKDDFTIVESMLILKEDLRRFLETNGYDKDRLLAYAKDLRERCTKIDDRYEEELFDGVKIFFSGKLAERPINVVIRKEILYTLAKRVYLISADGFANIKNIEASGEIEYMDYDFVSNIDTSVPLIEKRSTNIEAFDGLDRTGLKAEEFERRILLYKTKLEEKIYCQYPGKESIERSDRANDLRPELITSSGVRIDRLSIADILMAIYESRSDKSIDMIAAIFVCISYMILHEKEQKEHGIDLCDIKANKIKESSNLRFSFWGLTFDNELRDLLSTQKIKVPHDKHKSKISISLEAFMYYIDTLALQEDCKYAIKEPPQGRINYVSTLLRFIYRMNKDLPLGSIIGRAGLNVSPLKPELLSDVTNGLLKEEHIKDYLEDIY